MKMGNASVHKSQQTATCYPFASSCSSSLSPNTHDQCCFLIASLTCVLILPFLQLSLQKRLSCSAKQSLFLRKAHLEHSGESDPVALMPWEVSETETGQS